MGTNFAAFVADLFLYYFKKTSFSFCKNQANLNVAFTFTSRDLDGLLNIDNHYFEQIASPIKFVTGLQIFLRLMGRTDLWQKMVGHFSEMMGSSISN